VRRFVVDDRRGLDLLLATGADVAVTLRLLPPDSGEAPRSVVRFGNTADHLRGLARAAVAAGLQVEALSFFVGTNGAGMDQALPFRRGIEALARVYEQLHQDGIRVPTINIGGGFPGSRRRFHLDHPDFFARIKAVLAGTFGFEVSVLCEPGRYLAEPTLVLLTRVLATRQLAGRQLVYVDASAYCGLFGSTFIDPEDAPTIWSATEAVPLGPAELLGPIMDSFDVIQKGGRLPALREDDLLVLPNVGAYSLGYTATCEGLRPPGVVRLPDRLADALSAQWFA
jgi:diaminopimelate decarboxylase